MSSFFSRGGHSWRIARGYLEKCPEERKIVESLSFLLPVLKVIIRTLERLFKNLEKKIIRRTTLLPTNSYFVTLHYQILFEMYRKFKNLSFILKDQDF